MTPTRHWRSRPSLLWRSTMDHISPGWAEKIALGRNPELDIQYRTDVEADSPFQPPPYWVPKPRPPLGTSTDHPCNASLEFEIAERCSALRNAMELVEWLKDETKHPTYSIGSSKHRIFWKRGSVELHRPFPDGRLRIDHDKGEVQLRYSRGRRQSSS